MLSITLETFRFEDDDDDDYDFAKTSGIVTWDKEKIDQ